MAYTKSERNGEAVFQVSPEKAPIGAGFVVLAVITGTFALLVFVFFASGGLFTAGLIVALLIGIVPLLSVVGAHSDKRPSSCRLDYQFSVAGNVVRIGAREFNKEAIQRIAVVHWGRGISASSILGTVAVGAVLGGDALGAGLGALAADSVARKKVDPIAWGVQLESAGSAYWLGDGLTEVAARGLAAEVGAALGVVQKGPVIG